MSVPLPKMGAVEALLRTGNLSAAVEKLGISQPTVSPSFVDTLGLDFLLLLELYGRQHPVPDVFSFRVVERFDVVEHVLASFIA